MEEDLVSSVIQSAVDVLPTKSNEDIPFRTQRVGTLVETSSRVTLTWEDLEAKVKLDTNNACCWGGEVQEKKILRGVSGIAKPGTLLAVMGASGAGKTTFLNVLTARNIRRFEVKGHVYANGLEIGRGIKNISAYVQQNDLFIGTLTVREQLQFRALLRMDRKYSSEARLERVEQVIQEMGLSPCADTRIGGGYGSDRGISGGERKRLSFASEALTNPPLLFCDEPTSGLDSFMAQNIISSLERMAAQGHTILCTVHQPSSELFAMFNRVLFMTEGRTAFVGSSEAAFEFFSRLGYRCPNNFNPAEYYLLMVAIAPEQEDECREKANNICDAFSSSIMARWIRDDIEQQKNVGRTHSEDLLLTEMATGDSRFSSSWFKQFRYVFWRAWITQFRDVILFRIRVAQTIINSLLFGLIYLQVDISQTGVMDINGAIFILLTNISFTNILAVLNSFPIELGIFLREYGSGIYRSDVYFLCKTISEFPMFLFTSIVFVSIAYWLIGLQPRVDSFLIALLVYFLAATCAVSLGYCISTCAGSIMAALGVATPILVPLMLFGGLFINHDHIPIYFQWLKYLSWFRYGNEILMVSQWRHVDDIPCPSTQNLPPNVTTANRPPGPAPAPNCPFRSGEAVLAFTRFEKDNFAFDMVMMCVLIVLFRLLAFIALLVRSRRSQE